MGMMGELLDAAAARLSGPNVAALCLLFATTVAASVAMFVKAHPGPYNPRRWLRYAFPREILAHPSARADFLFWMTRRALMPLLLLPTAASVIVVVGYATHGLLGALLGAGRPDAGPAGPWTIALFTLTALLAYDLSYYLYHVAQHRVPALWELHKVHHSAEVLVGVTKDRIHPVDEIMNRAWDGLVVGVVYGVWLFFAVDPVEATVFGINVYVLRNILMMDLVRHTHLKVSFGPLNALVICPHWHQLHHSTDPRHFDRNFGLMFSIWDRLFGTLAVPARGESFSFGLGPREGPAYQSLYGLYVLPLRRTAAALLKLFRKKRPKAEPAGAGRPRVEILRDPAAFEALAPAWRDLHRRAGAEFFQSHDWIGAWWRSAGAPGGFRLHVALAWDGQDLVGALPLALRRHWGFRVLEWAAKDCTDRCDALLAPGPWRESTLAAMWRHVGRRGGFDVVYLSHARAGSAAALLARSGEGIELRRSRRGRGAPLTGVRLGAWKDGDAFFHSLGKKGRNNHLRGRRILETAGPVRFRVAAPDETGPLLERLRRFKLDWLRREGRTSPLFGGDGAPLRALVAALAGSGRLRLFVLEAGGKPAAGLLCFADGGTLNAYFTAYDPAFGRASPGSLVLVDAIRWAMREGFAEVDFLCGDEAYKDSLANQREELLAFSGARGLLGRLALAADERVPALARLAGRNAAAPEPPWGATGVDRSPAG